MMMVQTLVMVIFVVKTCPSGTPLLSHLFQHITLQHVKGTVARGNTVAHRKHCSTKSVLRLLHGAHHVGVTVHPQKSLFTSGNTVHPEPHVMNQERFIAFKQAS